MINTIPYQETYFNVFLINKKIVIMSFAFSPDNTNDKDLTSYVPFSDQKQARTTIKGLIELRVSLFERATCGLSGKNERFNALRSFASNPTLAGLRGAGFATCAGALLN